MNDGDYRVEGIDVEYRERADGKWAWHLRAANGRIVATDGGQGYRDEHDARRGFRSTMRSVVVRLLNDAMLTDDEEDGDK